MDRRNFLGIAPTLFASAVLAKPTDRVSSGPDAAELDITVVAPPATFSAARDGVQRAFASDWMPVSTTVRLRSWWPKNADPGFSELIRFGDRPGDLERAAQGYVVTVESTADPSIESLLTSLPPLSRTLTRVLSVPRQGNHWPDETLIQLIPEGNTREVRVPAYWDQQFWRQIAQSPPHEDGTRALSDVEAVRFSIAHLFQMEERNIAQVVALALVFAAAGNCRLQNRNLAILRCVSDHRGLLRTAMEII